MASAPVDEEQQIRLVGAIIDWRDADDLVHLDGAEKAEYQDAGLSYEPRNKPFQTVEELQLVLGMDKSVYKWIEPLVTVYSGQAQVKLQEAAKEVLQVIPGLDRGLVDSFIAARLESAKNNLPAPPFPSGPGLNNPSGLSNPAGLNNPSGLSNPAGLSKPAGQNNVLTVVSEALLKDGSKASVSVVIKKSDNAQVSTSPAPFEVLKWQRVTANKASLFTDAMNELLVKQYAEPELDN